MSRIWKQRTAEAKALAEPMSSTIARLKTSLTESDSQGLLLGCSSVLLAANADQTELLIRTCFGRPIITAEKDKHKQWFQLSLEEALYLSSIMKCMKLVVRENKSANDEELWCHLMSSNSNLPVVFKAYSHLRMKNWLVKSGSQYGVDFVAYRHHPSLVHAEYAVIVLSDKEGESKNDRLNSWSDLHCTLRLCGGVVKTLLVLHVRRTKGNNDGLSISRLDDYNVEERVVSRWNPKKRSNEGGEGIE